MGYVENNLMDGEEVVYKANIHWLILLPGILQAALGIAVVVLWGLSGEYRYIALGAGGLVILSALWTLLKALITKLTTELAVTTRRVIAKTGLIRRNTVEMNHSQVESFIVDQSILGRIFDFGTVIVTGTGGGQTPIPNIDSPLEFRRRALETIDSNQR